MKRKKIFWQLFPSYFFLAIFGIILVTVISNQLFESFYYQQTKKELYTKASLLKHSLHNLIIEKKYDDIKKICKQLGSESDTRITAILPNGTVIGDSDKTPELMDNHITRPEIYAALNGKIGQSIRYSATLKVDYMYLAIPLIRNTKIDGILRTSINMSAIQTPFKKVYHRLILILLALSTLIVFLSWALSRRHGKSLERMTKYAKRFAEGDFTKRINLERNDSLETSTLGIALNEMGDQIQNKIETISKKTKEQETILSNMIEGVLTITSSENIIQINNSARLLFKLSNDNYAGKKVFEILRIPQLNAVIETIIQTKKYVEQIIYLDGNKVIKIYGACIMTSDNDDDFDILLVFDDITKLHELENHRKQFVSNVSHELKTPLTAIQGFVETMLEKNIDDPDTIKEFLTIIKNNAKRLKTIIEDLLTIANLEKENKKIELASTPIKIIIDSATAICSNISKDKNIYFNISCDDNLNATINEQLIEQALINLIENAIKYGPDKNSIAIVARIHDNELIIEVSDTGHGIEEKHLERIFERFYTADKARSKKLGGSGLGLSIVKHIVQAHNGDIKVKSAVGVGTSFTIMLPL